MQTEISIDSLKPIGTKVLIKRPPVQVNIGKLIIPEEYRDRNNLNGMLYQGICIAVGDKTKAAKYGHMRDHFEPGDIIHFFHLYDWKDSEIVLRDAATGDSYLIVDESDIKAYELPEGDIDDSK